MEELALSCYGVEVRFVDAAGAGLCQRLRDTLPPEFAAPSGPGSTVVSYVVTAALFRGRRSSRGTAITRDGVEVFAAATEEDVFRWLCQDIDNTVAQRSRQMLFVHAGVVGWRGLAIVIPGRSHTGKSTLVAELVRRGAVYYSDEFAVLDDTGRVHPYRRPPVLRDETRQPQDLRLVREDEPTEPLPIGTDRGWGLPAGRHLAADHRPRRPSGLASHRWYGPGASGIGKDAANRCSRRARRRHAPGTAVRGDGSRCSTPRPRGRCFREPRARRGRARVRVTWPLI